MVVPFGILYPFSSQSLDVSLETPGAGGKSLIPSLMIMER
jgi:hypothetical protein